MARINWVEDDDATGAVGDAYQGWKDANPGRDQMPGILKCFSNSPPLLDSILKLSYEFHFCDSALDRRRKEMIATYVSALNQCVY